MSRSLYTDTHVVLAAVLVLLLILNAVLFWTVPVDGSTTATKDGELHAVVVGDSSCAQCIDAVQVLDGFGVFGIEFGSVERVERADAKRLIEKHELERFPAVVIEGEHELLDQFDVLEPSAGARVWRDLGAPYVDRDGALHGLVDLMAIDDPGCADCSDPALLATQLADNGMVFDRQEVMDVGDAQDLIDRYGITRVPTVILSAEAAEYAWLDDSWESLGTIETDGFYVLREVLPPYRDLQGGRVHGLVTATLITDEPCDTCVDPSLILTTLEDSFGLVIAGRHEFGLGSEEAESLMVKYGLDAAPTLLLDAEAGEYPAVRATWDQIGSVEDDGTFVVRNPEVFGG